MNAATDTTDTIAAPAQTMTPTRPFYWSVRRELWEHRALYIAPLGAAAVVLLGFLFNAVHLPRGLQGLAQLGLEQQRAAVAATYIGVGIVIALAAAAAAWFYSLDALQAERRDRSVLFWKSLPVSDTTAVLTKLFTALVVSPGIAFVVTLATELLLLVLITVLVLAAGASIAPIWNNLQLFELTLAMLYAFVVMSLWYAPIYAWLLLISSWARRATFLWAVLPPLGIIVFESLAFDTNHFAQMLAGRFVGGFAVAFVDHSGSDGVVVEGNAADARLMLPESVLDLLDPARFLGTPGLWVGLALAAGLVAAAVWMRRYREPI